MFQATKLIADEFQAAGIKFRVNEQENLSTVEALISGKQFTSVSLHFISKDDDLDVALRSGSIVKVPETKAAQILPVLNECNRKFRYLKFVIDSDNDVCAEYDFPIRSTNVGPTAVEIFIRAMKILDEVYPMLMKCVWG